MWCAQTLSPSPSSGPIEYSCPSPTVGDVSGIDPSVLDFLISGHSHMHDWGVLLCQYPCPLLSCVVSSTVFVWSVCRTAVYASKDSTFICTRGFSKGAALGSRNIFARESASSLVWQSSLCCSAVIPPGLHLLHASFAHKCIAPCSRGNAGGAKAAAFRVASPTAFYWSID